MSRRRIEQREVDSFGLVDCPGRDLPTLDVCAHCSDLVGVVTDAEELVIAVRCHVLRTD